MSKKISVSLESNKILLIDFKKLLNVDIPEEYQLFDLTSRRTHATILYEKCEKIFNEIIQSHPDFAVNYLAAKFAMHEENLSKDDVDQMVFNLLDDKVREIITKYVDERYTGDLDERTNSSKIKNTELQFTDAHSKVILEIVTVIHLFSPLVCHYYSKFVKYDKNNIVPHLIKVINYFSELNDINLYNKLYKLAESRVRSTQYSDIVFWTYAENAGLDMSVKIKELTDTLIRDVLHKLEYDQNIISMIHVCLKNQITYIINEKYLVSFKPVTINCNEENDVNPFDRVDTVFQHDESLSVLSSLNIESTIQSLEKRYGKINPATLNQLIQTVNINPVQTNLLFIFVAYYGEVSYDVLFSCSKKQYCKLLILMDSYFKQLNLTSLRSFLLSKPVPLKRKVALPKKFVSDVLTSKSFNEFIANKFSTMAQKIIESDIIFKIITNLSKNEFVCIFTNEPISITHESVTSEFISFIKSIS